MPKSKLLGLPSQGYSALTREEAIEICTEAYDLRLKGMTYDQIADKLEISRSQAWRRCNIITEFKLKGLVAKDDSLKVEINDKLDLLLSRWLPLAMKEDLMVGETKHAANGQEYDVMLPAWEASSGATKHVLEILREKVRVNGVAPREGRKGLEISPEAAGAMAAGWFEAMKKLAGGKPALRAEVVDGQERTEA